MKTLLTLLLALLAPLPALSIGYVYTGVGRRRPPAPRTDLGHR